MTRSRLFRVSIIVRVIVVIFVVFLGHKLDFRDPEYFENADWAVVLVSVMRQNFNLEGSF